MKAIKRIAFGWLLILLSSLLFVRFNYRAVSATTKTGGGEYYTETRKETNALAYGVNHFIDIGQSFSSLATGNDAVFRPQQVNVLEVPSSKDVRVTSWANLSGHRWTLTTVRTLIADYESKNPGWRVIGAVNGDFFDISAKGNLPYQTSGPVVSNGEFYKTSGGSVKIGFTNNGTSNSLIGNRNLTRTEYMQLSIYDQEDSVVEKFDIHKLNEEPNKDEVALYYGNYDTDHKYNEITVPHQANDNIYVVGPAELALPNNPNDFYGKGIISSIGTTTLKVGQFAIVTEKEEIKALLNNGVKIRAQWEYVGDYSEATDVTAGSDEFLYDGEYVDHNRPVTSVMNYRHPRTVIGKKADGTIVMMVVDGRQLEKGMAGAFGNELAAMMKHYGVIEAYNLDGGGSSTMVIRKDGELKVMNSPSDGRERSDANAILVVARDPEIDFSAFRVSTNSFSLYAELKNKQGYDIQKLFVIIDDKKYYLDKTTIDIKNLKSNAKIILQFGYVNSKGEEVLMITQGTVKTYQEIPKFLGLEVTETENEFHFKLLFDDSGDLSTIISTSLSFGKYMTPFRDGKIVIKKEFVPNLDDIRVNMTLATKDNRSVTIWLPHKIVYVDLYQLQMQHDNMIADIYR